MFVPRLLGAGESEAESKGGAGQTTGPARALQEMFHAAECPLGQEPSQRARAEVTSERDRIALKEPRRAGAGLLASLEELTSSRLLSDLPVLLPDASLGFLVTYLAYLQTPWRPEGLITESENTIRDLEVLRCGLGQGIKAHLRP